MVANLSWTGVGERLSGEYTVRQYYSVSKWRFSWRNKIPAGPDGTRKIFACCNDTSTTKTTAVVELQCTLALNTWNHTPHRIVVPNKFHRPLVLGPWAVNNMYLPAEGRLRCLFRQAVQWTSAPTLGHVKRLNYCHCQIFRLPSGLSSQMPLVFPLPRPHLRHSCNGKSTRWGPPIRALVCYK